MSSLLCDRSMFGHLAAHLASRYRVLNVDLRGHGKSTAPTRPYTLEDQADDIVAMLDASEVADAAMVGLSQGGMTAMRAAIYHPKRVRALALLDTSADPESFGRRAEYLTMAASVRLFGVTSIVAERVKPLMFSEGFLARRPDVVAKHADEWAALDTVGVYHATAAVALRTDIGPLLADIAVPALVLTGGDDRALPPERSRRVAERIRGARYVVVPGAGHLSTIEEPEETTRIVAAFLDEHLLRAS